MMLSPIDKAAHNYLDEVADDTDDEELLTEEEEIVEEESAILAWLQTFPQISQDAAKQPKSLAWMDDKMVSE